MSYYLADTINRSYSKECTSGFIERWVQGYLLIIKPQNQDLHIV